MVGISEESDSALMKSTILILKTLCESDEILFWTIVNGMKVAEKRAINSIFKTDILLHKEVLQVNSVLSNSFNPSHVLQGSRPVSVTPTRTRAFKLNRSDSEPADKQSLDINATPTARSVKKASGMPVVSLNDDLLGALENQRYLIPDFTAYSEKNDSDSKLNVTPKEIKPLLVPSFKKEQSGLEESIFDTVPTEESIRKLVLAPIFSSRDSDDLSLDKITLCGERVPIIIAAILSTFSSHERTAASISNALVLVREVIKAQHLHINREMTCEILTVVLSCATQMNVTFCY